MCLHIISFRGFGLLLRSNMRPYEALTYPIFILSHLLTQANLPNEAAKFRRMATECTI